MTTREAVPKLTKAERDRAPPVAIGLTRHAVVSAALSYIDRHGLADFSIRSLAKELGVNPTVVTWHVGNRNVLLAEVVAAVQEDLAPIWHAGETWQDWLRALFDAYRAAIRRHPNVAPLIGSELVSNAKVSLGLIEGVLRALTDAGFAGQPLRGAFSAVIAAMAGFTTQEFAPVPNENLDQWRDEMRRHLATVEPDRYPLLASNLPLMINQAFVTRWNNGVDAPLDNGFLTFVDCMIAGFERVGAECRGERRDPARTV